MTILIPNLAIAGYRSFGKTPQYFNRFAKINIFIGQNNSGKSNVLRFIHDVYPKLGRGSWELDPLSRHMPDRPPMLLGIGFSFEADGSAGLSHASKHKMITSLEDSDYRDQASGILAKIFKEKARLDETELCWTLLSVPECKDESDSWLSAVRSLEYHELCKLLYPGQNTAISRENMEISFTSRLSTRPAVVNAELIPAIRKIGTKGSVSEGYDGTGIIERIAKLQNPDVHNQDDRTRFYAIQDFFRDVVNKPDATIEIPYERDTILVHMDGRVLPVDSLGSGIHDVLILASAATVLTQHVVCIEEPELHLNPVLQKKLLSYLSAKTENQYFITTHSAALMDTPKAEVYHIRLGETGSSVEHSTSDDHRVAVCEDLGYHPSDLLQANCIIWVEGPSDRIYVNWWLAGFDPSLIEGIHYSIMFYGGRLAAHLSNSSNFDPVNDFISLRRLNRRGVMVIDSDRKSQGSLLNETKKRLIKEFNQGPGHAWVTAGREIENYLRSGDIKEAVSAVHPTAKHPSESGKFASLLRLKSANGKEFAASKVEIARHIASRCSPSFEIHDLRTQVQKLARFIHSSNPQMDASLHSIIPAPPA